MTAIVFAIIGHAFYASQPLGCLPPDKQRAEALANTAIGFLFMMAALINTTLAH